MNKQKYKDALKSQLQQLPKKRGNERESRSERRRAARELAIPKDRICPTCGKGPIVKTRGWVVFVVPGVVECVACSRLRKVTK